MFESSAESFRKALEEIKASGLYKRERLIESPQSSKIRVAGKEVLNFCANNYLGLANHPRLIEAAKEGLDEYGFGLSSVRFICGTQTIHREFEKKLATFLKQEDSILYAACFDANGGIFEALLGEDDAVISDALNHASIIDGIRLCKAKRFRYKHSDMEDLEKCLKEARAQGAKKVLVVTDGAFSMDGEIAPLREIAALTDKYEALLMVDDCHATGFLGTKGRGSAEHCKVEGRVDIVNSTLGKALGGAIGGFTSSRNEIIETLRQRSRPYLFSNSLPPSLVMAGLVCISMLEESDDLREKLHSNTKYFREEVKAQGFSIKGNDHPIVPLMLGDEKLAVGMADALLNEGIYVIGFSFPVVPRGEARIRIQISAGHSKDEIDQLLEALSKIGREMGCV